jgi:glutathione synthase/RimK-type ligase-like ATP-grasp enzyme
MRVLLIGNSESGVFTDPEGYFKKYDDFLKGAVQDDDDISAEFTLFDDLYLSVGDGELTAYDTRHGLQLHDVDVLLLRGGGFRKYTDVIKLLSVYAQANGMVVINDYSGFRDSSKLTQAVQFHQLGLPVACSVYVTDAVLAGKHPLSFAFPCILKATFGSHGDDNYVVQSLEEVATITSKTPGKKFVLQRFVPNDKDYRLLIIGDEVTVISRTGVEGSHLNNTSKGGQASLEAADTVPAEIIDGAKRISKHLDMTISGVDVLADKNTGEFYFLEVNAQPQLMTGALLDVKSKMVGDYLRQLKTARG